MKYFKVKAEADQIRKSLKGCDFLIAHELYTEKELLKFTKPNTPYVLCGRIPKNKHL